MEEAEKRKLDEKERRFAQVPNGLVRFRVAFRSCALCTYKS